MATPKGHKAGCKCVACSPATRKKGQAALKKRQAEGEGTAAKPTKTRRKNGSGKTGGKTGGKTPRAQRTADNTTIVVNMPAQPAAAKKPRQPRRKNPAPAQAAASAEPRARNIGLPSLEAGRFLVIVAQKGKGVTSVRAFKTQKDAREYAAGVNAERVRVCEVSHSAG